MYGWYVFNEHGEIYSVETDEFYAERLAERIGGYIRFIDCM